MKAALTILRSLPKNQLMVAEGVPASDSFEGIRDMVSCALRKQCQLEQVQQSGGEVDMDTCYCWVQNMYPDRVVYSMDGKNYMRTYSIDKDDNVTFGSSGEVEQSWQPVGESSRMLVPECLQLIKESYNASKGELTITVIKPGFNLSKSRYYPAATLKRDYRIFEGAKMFVDHATDAQDKQRPEGSVRDWVANVTKVWAESDGTVKAKATVHEPAFKARLDGLNEKGLLSEMGTSIRAIGQGSRQKIEGVETNYVESLVKSRSVDFVTFAGAGGQVDAIESDAVADIELITEAQLRETRPDLVSIIESKHEVTSMKTIEQQLQEATANNTTLATENASLKTQIAESNRKAAVATAAGELNKLLSEAKLPKPAEDRIRVQFKEADKVEGMKEAIEGEATYIKSLGAPVVVTERKVRNMGEADNTGAAGEGKINLVESFMSMGMTKEEATIAAKVN